MSDQPAYEIIVYTAADMTRVKRRLQVFADGRVIGFRADKDEAWVVINRIPQLIAQVTPKELANERDHHPRREPRERPPQD